MTIRVADVVGANCVTLDDGDRIREAVRAGLSECDVVTLDFDRVQVIASPFFNAAIGRLLKDMPEGELRAHVEFTGLSDAGQHILERVIQNSAEYYADPSLSNAIDTVLQHQGAEDAD